jgi:cytochrome P450
MLHMPDVHTQSDEELRDVVMSFVIAGRDTTAACLTWCFSELGKHPEIAGRLEEEIDQVLHGDPTYDDVHKNMPLLHVCV